MIASGVFPILAFVIGGSFAIYGTIKKYISYDSETSLFAETLWCAPFALLFIGMMEVQNKGVLYQFDWKIAGLLCISGIVTLIPLVFYAHGVKQCPYYITGILMYINPTLQMIMGLVFGETIKGYQIVSFCCIWIGIIILIYHNLK